MSTMKKTTENYNFDDFLLDDDFVRSVNDLSCAEDYITRLKVQYPNQAKNIDLALEVLSGIENKYIASTQPQRQKIWNGIASVFAESISGREKASDSNTKKRSLVYNPLFRIAAGLILLLGIGCLIHLGNKKDLSIDRFAASNKVNLEKSQLILSNGEKIEVPAGEAKISYSPDGASVKINDSSDVIQSAREEQFNQITVPYGKYVSLQLSDGTKVWLNSGSRMIYPPVFAEKQREVYLQGEGYFEVTQNAQKPFFVKTDRMRVEVLGTKFDVQAFDKENSYSTLLLEGTVSLSTRQKLRLNHDDILLKPSERGELSQITSQFKVEKIDHPANYIAWMYGYLNFEDEALESLIKRVSRYYNIDIQIKSDVGEFKISGKLDLKNDPERVLKGIAVIANQKVTKQEGGFTISN